MHDKIIKKIINTFVVIFITILIATIIVLLIMKYHVEGENNMPFELSKIMVISTAEGQDVSNGDSQTKWNLNIIQNNDVYLEIAKNKNYKEIEIIDEVIIDNFKIEEAPKKGIIKIYKPTTEENTTYRNIVENEIKENLIYTGKEKSTIKNLEIANQGGLILFRYSIEELGEFTSDAEEMKHDGTIISQVGVGYEELICKVSFDLSIKLKSEIIYTGNVILDLPGGNILEEGTSHYERTNLKDIIFKRNLR